MKLKLSVFFTILIVLFVELIYVFSQDVVEPVSTESYQTTISSKIKKTSKPESVVFQTVKTLDTTAKGTKTKVLQKHQSEIEQFPETVFIYNSDAPDELPQELSREEYIQQLTLAESDVDMGYERKQKLENDFFLIGGQIDNDDQYYFDKDSVNVDDIEKLEMLRDTLASVMMQVRFREKLLQRLTYRP